jgi:hypothetical protein
MYYENTTSSVSGCSCGDLVLQQRVARSSMKSYTLQYWAAHIVILQKQKLHLVRCYNLQSMRIVETSIDSSLHFKGLLFCGLR